MTKHIGFVGIGTMGKPMASNLLKAGFEVTVVPHINMAPARALEIEGATVVKTAREVASNSEVVVTCLPNSPDVEEVIFGTDGLMEGAKEGLIIIDTSTITPIAAQQFSEKVAQKGCVLLDSPMSGGEAGAIAATLTFMVGGDATAVEQARDVFDGMGKQLYHVGASGMGATVKLGNNLMLGINLVGVCEAFTFGVKAGVDARTMAEVVQASSGGSAVIERYFPKTIIKNQYTAGFMLKLMCKDMNLALDAAKALNVPTFAGTVAGQVLDMVNNMGKGDDDFTVIATLYQDVAGIIIGKED